MSQVGTPRLVRVSLGIYNSKKEANVFLDTLNISADVTLNN